MENELKTKKKSRDNIENPTNFGTQKSVKHLKKLFFGENLNKLADIFIVSYIF